MAEHVTAHSDPITRALAKLEELGDCLSRALLAVGDNEDEAKEALADACVRLGAVQATLEAAPTPVEFAPLGFALYVANEDELDRTPVDVIQRAAKVVIGDKVVKDRYAAVPR